MTKFSFVTLALLAGAGCAVVACSSDGDDTAAAGGSGGSAGKASSGGSAGKSSTAGTGAVAEGGAAGAAAEGTIYDRLGGNTGIRGAVEAIVAAEVKDPMIASYFSQSGSPSYSPSVQDIEDCLVLLLGMTTGGPEVYPGKAASGFQCRSMVEAHANLGINGDTFNAFVGIAAGVLTAANVKSADLTVIGGALAGLQPAIVTDKTSKGERACEAPAACFLGSAGAGGAG